MPRQVVPSQGTSVPTGTANQPDKQILDTIKRNVERTSASPSATTGLSENDAVLAAQDGVQLENTPGETEALFAILGTAIFCIVWLFLLFAAGANSKGRGSFGNTFCALNSLTLPGLGQIAQRRIVSGILFMVAAAGLWFVLMGWVIHIWSALNAALWKGRNPPPA
jgi:hypothetical protein